MKRLFLLLTACMLSLQVLYAQQVVSGKVTDDAGQPVEGVTVIAKGTTSGVFTDINGDFSLQVPDGVTTLVFRYVGRQAQEVAISGSTVNVTMLAEDVTLDEVVVTALGISREKKTLGYATQEVGGDEVTRVKDVNFINSLSGKVAGVDIKRSNTMGGSANVVVRGYKSITNNNQALFVVDGVPMSNAITNTTNQQTGRGGYDFGNAAMDINPEDIESINVLKGAAASALYGSRAANGVIMITTKKGKKGKGLGISVTSGLTLGQIDKETFPEYQKEYGPGYTNIAGWYGPDVDNRALWRYDFGLGDGPQLSAATEEDASYGPALDGSMAYNWKSYSPDWKYYGQAFPLVATENDASTFYETMKTWNTNVAVDGGSDNGSYRLSWTNLDQKGIVPNSQIKRNSIAFTGSYDLSEKFTVSSSVNYVITEGRGRYGTGYDNRNPNQSFRQWYQTTTDFVELEQAYIETGKNISWNPYGAANPAQLSTPHYFDNQYFIVNESVPTDERARTFGNITLNYELTDWLNIMGRVTTDRYSEIQEERIAVGSIDVSKYERYNRTFEENNFDLMLNASKRFGDNFSIDGMIGTNVRRTTVESIRVKTNGGLVVPNVYSLQNSISSPEAPVEGSSQVGVNGYFGRASFGLANMIYLDLTGRYDVFSTLPIENNSDFYPSASLSFVFSELFGNNEILNYGKLRLNYAEVSNGAPAQSIINTYPLGTPFNGVPLASVRSTQNNPELVPERTQNLEAGIEMNFFQNRVGLDLSVYQSNTFDQLIPVTVTAATGYTSKYVNVGEVENKGVEISLNVSPVRTKDFSWDIRFNWAANRNKVIELFEDQTNLQLNNVQGGITLNATVGEPFGAIWGTNYVFHTDGSPIVYPHWNSGVRYRKTGSPEVIGNIQPDWKGGVYNSLNFKGVTLGFLIDMQKGGQFFSLDTWYGTATGIYQSTAGTNKDGVERRALPEDGGGTFIDGAVVQTGTDADGNPISDGTPNEEAFYVSDVYNSEGYVYAPNAHHVHDASFVKLRELSLTYSLPASILGNSPIQGIDISFVGRNLWIIHKNSPYTDPEAGLSAGNNLGNQSGAYPAVKEYGLNLGLKF